MFFHSSSTDWLALNGIVIDPRCSCCKPDYIGKAQGAIIALSEIIVTIEDTTLRRLGSFCWKKNRYIVYFAKLLKELDQCTAPCWHGRNELPHWKNWGSEFWLKRRGLLSAGMLWTPTSMMWLPHVSLTCEYIEVTKGKQRDQTRATLLYLWYLLNILLIKYSSTYLCGRFLPLNLHPNNCYDSTTCHGAEGDDQGFTLFVVNMSYLYKFF